MESRGQAWGHQGQPAFGVRSQWEEVRQVLGHADAAWWLASVHRINPGILYALRLCWSTVAVLVQLCPAMWLPCTLRPSPTHPAPCTLHPSPTHQVDYIVICSDACYLEHVRHDVRRSGVVDCGRQERRA